MTSLYMKKHPYCIENRAKACYGETGLYECAGYLLGDGTMLNFSYEGFQRDEDHRNIGQFFTHASGWDAMVAFMKRGNIRMNCNRDGYRFEFTEIPTEQQLAVMRRAETMAYRYGIEFLLEQADFAKWKYRQYASVDEIVYDLAA